MMKTLKKNASLALLASVVLLAGCATSAGTSHNKTATPTRVADAMASAARDASGSGRLSESLAINQKLYRTDPNNPNYILAYGRDLRRAGKLDDARLVVRTPALSATATAPLLTEAAMVLVTQGNYTEGLDFAEKAVAKQVTSPDAYQAQALALSGLNRHAEAEAAFTKALTLWPQMRDKTAIINNLAMSQVAQGKISDANTTMTLATGQALGNAVYQNNRAFLSSLRDRPVAAPINMPAMKVVDVTQEPTINTQLSNITTISKTEPAAGTIAVIAPPPDVVLKAELPKPLFDNYDSETSDYMSKIGFTPYDESKRRFGLNN